MVVEDTIAELNRAISSSASERDLLGLLASRLSSLRSKYREARELFEPEHIAVLRTMRAIHVAIEDFCDVLDDLPTLKSENDAADALQELRRLARIVSGLPVQARIEKEIRGVHERIPALRARNNHSGEKVINSRSHFGATWSA